MFVRKNKEVSAPVQPEGNFVREKMSHRKIETGEQSLV